MTAFYLTCSVFRLFVRSTHRSNIDPALLRKGRLTASYEFKELSLDKARNLAKELKKPALPEREMTLADVYGLEAENFTPDTKKAIGFIL